MNTPLCFGVSEPRRVSRGVHSHREKAKCADYSTNQPTLIKKLDHYRPKAEPLYRYYVSVWEIKTSGGRLTQTQC